jgi:hypothetical protein
MYTLFRIVAGAALFAFGYYLGKQVGLLDSARQQTDESRMKSSRLRSTNEGETGDAGDEPRT